MLHLAPGIAVDPNDLHWSACRSGGPGGQHVNTTASAVELRVHLDALVGLVFRQRERLEQLAGNRLTGDMELVLTCDETRSQGRNRDLLLERFQALVRDAATLPRPRRATRPTRGSVERRLTAKATRSQRLDERKGGDQT